MAITTRLATADDAATLASLVAALRAHQGDPVEHATSDNLLRDGLGRPDAEFRAVLAEAEGAARGYALVHTTYSTEFAERGLFVYDLFVAEAARREGVGRALVAAVCRLAKAEGRSFLWWVSKPWNKEAHAVYRRLGAIEDDIKLHAIFGDAFDRLAGD